MLERFLIEEERFDIEERQRRLRRRLIRVVRPVVFLGSLAITFGSWLAGGAALAIAGFSAWLVKPAFERRPGPAAGGPLGAQETKKLSASTDEEIAV